MVSTPAEQVDTGLLAAIRQLAPTGEAWPEAALPAARAIELFDDQCTSRQLDFAARWMQARGRGYHTVGSAGHEGNVAVAAVLRASDPALLHYRSGGFYVTRARQVPGHDPVADVLRGVAAAADEPIAGGRHKVFGHAGLAVIPQTSTIGSHVPRAVGMAVALARARKLGVPCRWPSDAVVVCSFGDASANHSTLLGGVNAACHTAHQGHPLPLLLVCEDNGIGISVRTPEEWIAAAYGHRPGLRYFAADGSDLAEAYRVAREAAEYVRTRRRPAFLHLRTVRLLGHAGSDVEAAYRPASELAEDLARDPVVATARLLARHGVLSPDEILQIYQSTRRQVRGAAEAAMRAPRLDSAAAVVAPLAPRHPGAVAAAAAAAPTRTAPATLAQAVNDTLADELERRPNMLVFGEDVAVKGGVYGVTRGLRKRFGGARVFDTLLDEQAILGLALGAGVSGLLPVPEIQYLAYLHNAEDQLRGEAATLQFFSQGRYRNGMVVRVAGLGYQRGFGGHFHNDNAVGVLRDVPGLVIAVPARPHDAAGMLRTCLAAADVDGSVSVMLEPIALYHTRHLHTDGDEEWLAAPAGPVPVGQGRVYGDGDALTIVTYGNGLWLSLRVARRLYQTDGIRSRVLDLRWLAPLPAADLSREATATGRVLVVDETRRTGGVAEGVFAALVDAGYRGPLTRVCGADSFIPLGEAAGLVLVSEQQIEEAARELVRRDRAGAGSCQD